MIDAERRGNRRCANKRQERGTEGGRERPTKTECGRQTKEGREGGTVRRVGGKKFEEGKQKRFGLDGEGEGEDGGECWGV